MNENNNTHSPIETLIAAIGTGDEAKAAAIARSLAAGADANPPALYHTLNLLGYHDRLPLINEIMAIAWPRVQEAAAFSSKAVQAYAGRATDHLLYAYLAGGGDPEAPDAALQERLAAYFPVDAERLGAYLGLLAGNLGRPWQRADFAELDGQRLQGLLLEFLGYVHRRDVPYARAHLLREHLPCYLLDREAGYLYPKQDVGALLRSGRRPRPFNPQPEHRLLPDAETLENYLEKLGRTVTPQPYVIAALLALLPLWSEFLASRGLATAEQAVRAAQEVAQARDSLQSLLASFGVPVLRVGSSSP